MGVGTSFTVCSLFFIALLAIVFFSKQRLITLENKIYSYIIIVSLIGTIIGFPCYYFVKNYELFPLAGAIISKLYLIYLILWIMLFTLYVFIISKSKMENKKIINVSIFLGIICCITVCLLPLYFKSDGETVYTYGPSANFVYLISAIAILIMVVCLIKNIKNIRQKKFIPLIAFLIFGTVVMVIQRLNPELLLITFCEAFITFLMYFTIENPDVQMIEELYKNRKIIEKSNEDTSRFLFRMTQDIKKPVKDIILMSHDASNIDDVEELKSDIKYINNYANQIDYLMNKALNISNMNTQSIKVFDTRYNVKNLFKEVSFRAKEDIKPNLEFDFDISDNIPTYLYGDSIKLKQAISSVINIANDFTKEGFISLDVSSIVRYNMCRLIITIEDSGKGIGIDRINQILSLTGDDLKDIDTKNNDDRNLDILAVKKVVSMLGGSLMIKSEEGVGTTVTIILEQKVVETKETEISKKLESYEQSLYGEKQVLIVDDDEKELDKIEKQISSDGIMVSSSVYGRDAIEKVRSKLKYDLIILDDELGSTSALEVLKELQKIKNFKTPVVVMINDNKEGIKLHYLKDGFADTISKSKLESEIDRVMKRF